MRSSLLEEALSGLAPCAFARLTAGCRDWARNQTDQDTRRKWNMDEIRDLSRTMRQECSLDGNRTDSPENIDLS